jgi:hypothetical protein
MVLVQLLQEDYIKWKGTMFFRALRSTVDQVQDHTMNTNTSKSAYLFSRFTIEKKWERTVTFAQN